MRELFPTLFLLMAVAGCQKDPTVVGTDTADAITFEGAVAIAASEAGGEAIEFVWEADADRIGLFSTKDGRAIFDNVYYAAFTSTPTARFISPSADKQVLWENETEAQDFYAYYPYRSTVADITSMPVSIPAEQLVKAGEMPWRKSDFVWYAKCENRRQTDGSIALSFKNVCGVVRCTVTTDLDLAGVESLTLRSLDGETLAFDQGTLDIVTGELTVVDGVSNSVCVKFETPVNFGVEPQSFYVALAPGLAGKSLELSVDLGDMRVVLGELKVPAEGLAGGEWTPYNIGCNVPVREGVDLSAGGTANTYIVTAPATTYRFRANVKGNGMAREYAWTIDGAPVSKSYTDADLALSPAEARLIWYNTPMGADGWSHESPVVAESVTFDRLTGCVYFDTPEKFVAGNALLAVYDASGQILWSWNIWALEGYDADAAARTVGRYTVMDRNLGAMAGREAMNTSDPREAAWAIGNYYQWGRKDPFPAAATYANGGNIGNMEWGLPTYTPIDELKRDCSAAVWGAEDMMFSNVAAQNAYGMAAQHGAGFTIDDAVEASVRNPYRWVTSGTDENSAAPYYMWMAQGSADMRDIEWRYLWGSTDASSSEKSIYDPCPPGWKVPTVDMYEYLLGDVRKGEYGVYSAACDLYVPFAGQRQAGFGGSRITGLTSGAIFLASASTTSQYYPFKGNYPGNTMASSNSYAGAGIQMRCVKEHVAVTMAPKGRQSGPVAALMGNSITEQWPIRGRKEFFTDNDYLGKGISGQTSLTMVNRFHTDILAHDPRCVVITGGTNDMADNDGYFRSIEDVVCNVRLMAERAHEYGAKVIIGSVAPTRDMWWKDDSWKALYNGDAVAQRIIELNKLLKAYADSRGFLYADYHSVLRDEADDLKEEYRWGADHWDHVHPNYDGYTVMEGVLKPLVDAALYDPDNGNVGGSGIDDLNKWIWE